LDVHLSSDSIPDLAASRSIADGASSPAIGPATCLDAGDEYGLLQLRCYAAAGLSDAGIIRRALRRLGIDEADQPVLRHDDAAIAIARHAAIVGMAPREIIALLARIGVDLPAAPSEPERIAIIVKSACEEFSA
jgi:hypothetical protein